MSGGGGWEGRRSEATGLGVNRSQDGPQQESSHPPEDHQMHEPSKAILGGAQL